MLMSVTHLNTIVMRMQSVLTLTEVTLAPVWMDTQEAAWIAVVSVLRLNFSSFVPVCLQMLMCFRYR